MLSARGVPVCRTNWLRAELALLTINELTIIKLSKQNLHDGNVSCAALFLLPFAKSFVIRAG